MKKIITILFLFLKIFSENKNFVIIIPSYNNSLWYKQNLDSAINQNYSNFRIIYIDDSSTDQNDHLVEKYISQLNHTQKNKILFIKNNKRIGSLANYYNAIHLCKPNEIIVCLDGDDYLFNENVLSYLNEIYQNPNVWVTYGSYIKFPGFEIGGAAEIPYHILIDNKIRESDFVSTHLKTFYAKLFQNIKQEDLMYQNHFFEMAGDVAFILPIIEMSGIHSRFISKILYCYNITNPISDRNINVNLQIYLEKIIRNKSKYQPLEKLDV